MNDRSNYTKVVLYLLRVKGVPSHKNIFLDMDHKCDINDEVSLSLYSLNANPKREQFLYALELHLKWPSKPCVHMHTSKHTCCLHIW